MLAQAVEHLIKNIVDFPDDVSVKSHETRAANCFAYA